MKELIVIPAVFACVWFSSMLFFDQVVYKINPELDEKYAKYISITLGLIFGIGAFFFGGGGQPYLLDEYN